MNCLQSSKDCRQLLVCCISRVCVCVGFNMQYCKRLYSRFAPLIAEGILICIIFTYYYVIFINNLIIKVYRSIIQTFLVWNKTTHESLLRIFRNVSSISYQPHAQVNNKINRCVAFVLRYTGYHKQSDNIITNMTEIYLDQTLKSHVEFFICWIFLIYISIF